MNSRNLNAMAKQAAGGKSLSLYKECVWSAEKNEESPKENDKKAVLFHTISFFFSSILAL